MVDLYTIVYHTRSKVSFPSLPTENCKGKVKATNAKFMCKTIENKCLSEKLVSNLEQKIKKLEEELLHRREWAKLLLSANPTLETNMDMSPFTSQVTLQNNPPPDYSTSQSQSSSIQMPPKNIYFPNHPYPPQHHSYTPKPQHLTLHPHHPTMEAPQYEKPLHQLPWHHTPFIQLQIPPYEMSLYQRPPLPSRQPTYPVNNAKVITRPHVCKNLVKVEEIFTKYTLL